MSDTVDLKELTKSFDRFDIAIVGDDDVGKTSLLKKFFGSKFSSFSRLRIHVDSKLDTTDYKRKAFTLKFWTSLLLYANDTAKSSSHGVIIVYDCTNHDSFDNVKRLLEEIDGLFLYNVAKMIIGNKCDLHSQREVDYMVAKEYADKLRIPFMETSALDSTGLRNALKILLPDIRSKERIRVQQEREQKKQEQREEEQRAKARQMKMLQKRRQQKKEQQEKERIAKVWHERIKRRREQQAKQRQETRRRRREQQAKQWRLKIQHERNQKDVVKLLIPFLKTSMKNAVTVGQSSLMAATEMQTQVNATSDKEIKTESFDEPEKSVCTETATEISENWEKWRKIVELYLTAKDIIEGERKTATLLRCAGEHLRDFYFAIVEENENIEAAGPSQSSKAMEHEKAMSLIDKYYSMEKNSLYERLIFRTMQQKPKETVAQYAMRLKRQALNCGFGRMLGEHVRDQIIGTCKSAEMTKKFLEMGQKLTLKRLLEISQSMEAIDGEQYTEEM